MVYEAVCTPPAGTRTVKDKDCPISGHQLRVAAAEQVSIESVQEQVETLLEGRIVVGCDITNDLKVLGASLPPEMVRDLQLHFSAERCSKPDLRGSGLPALGDGHSVHSLEDLAKHVLEKPIQEGPHSALMNARAIMELYLMERGRIEK